MALYFIADFADGTGEDFRLACTQEAAVVWKRVADRFNFQRVTGVFPMSVNPEDVDLWISEVRTLREVLLGEKAFRDDESAAAFDDVMNRFLAALERLRVSTGWTASVG